MEVAKSYTTHDAAEYRATAKRFRLPYWDWATKSVPPPEVISQKTVSYIAHDGTNHTIDNPLYQYKFHPLQDGGFGLPWSQWPATLRCPTSEDASAQTDVTTLTK